MDSLNYHYNTANNQLNFVTDNIDSSNYTEDIFFWIAYLIVTIIIAGLVIEGKTELLQKLMDSKK
ncbi:MAG: hypothetical protein M3004_00495 [Bacteroidota bacterium]|nr:hypothetical protein [Bacteroidota bacterium]